MILLRPWHKGKPFVIGLLALALLISLVRSSRSQGSVEITVPQAAITPMVDGQVNLSSEYIDAATLQLSFPATAFSSPVYAHFVYTQNDLYIAVIYPVAQGGVSLNTSSLAFLFDPDFSRGAAAQSTDYQIEVPFDGSPARWLVGNGAGAYVAPPSPPSFGPSGQWYARTAYCATEFSFPCVEVRISREQLGDFSEIDGFAMVHRNLTISGATNSHPSPPTAVYGVPSTWASLLYVNQSADLPRAKLSGTVRDVSLGNTAGLGGHSVFIYSAGSSAHLYIATTDPTGNFEFDVPVPADTQLELKIAECTNCRYEPPTFGSVGIAALSSTTHSITFPGCPSGTSECVYRPAFFRIWRPESVGAAEINSYNPTQGEATVLLRDGSPPLTTSPTQSTIRIFGENLHPFGRVYLHLQTQSCQVAPPRPECPVVAATILSHSPAGDFIDVAMPAVARGNYFWVFRDDWPRPANSGVGAAPWRFGPTFPVIDPPFPELHGFGFLNVGSGTDIDEFMAVYQYNAFVCPGVWDGGVCIIFTPIPVPSPPVPEPRYWAIWFPIFKIWLESGGDNNGTCVGMAATSQLMFHNHVRPDQFDPAVHFARGFDALVRPAHWDPDDFPNVPIPRPVNVWAEIRKNHGVQTSAQFVAPVIDDSAQGAVHTLNRIRPNPNNWVLCLREGTSGHCVTPFRVVDVNPGLSRIHVYDNNAIDETRVIEVNLTTGRASYQMVGGPIWDDWLVAIPVSVWLNPRSAMDDLPGIITSAVFGEASVLYSDEAGGRWGIDPGTQEWVEDMDGAVTMPLMEQAANSSNSAMLMLPNGGSPTATISSNGDKYVYLASNEGVTLQLIKLESTAGHKDEVTLGNTGNQLNSFRFSPESATDAIVPRVSMKLGEETSAVFTWQGLNVHAGAEVGFTALPDQKGVAITNDGPASMSYSLIVQMVDGDSGTAGNATFNAIEIMPGATQRLSLTDWPHATSLRIETDSDGDGVYESSQQGPAGVCLPQDLDNDGFDETCMPGAPAPRQLYLPVIIR